MHAQVVEGQRQERRGGLGRVAAAVVIGMQDEPEIAVLRALRSSASRTSAALRGSQ
jgi:hypothetical protein